VKIVPVFPDSLFAFHYKGEKENGITDEIGFYEFVKKQNDQ